MPPVPSTLQEILRCLVLRLVLMVESALSVRVAGLWGRLAGMRVGHRHRARLERELAKAERYAALLADPAFWADKRAAGKAMEVARVAADAGRLALVRRMIWPRRVRRPRAFALVAGPCDWGGRCTGGVGEIGGFADAFAAAPLTQPSRPSGGGEGFFGAWRAAAEGGFRRRFRVYGGGSGGDGLSGAAWSTMIWAWRRRPDDV